MSDRSAVLSQILNSGLRDRLLLPVINVSIVWVVDLGGFTVFDADAEGLVSDIIGVYVLFVGF